MCLLCPFLFTAKTSIWVLGAVRSLRKTVYQVDHPSGSQKQQYCKRLRYGLSAEQLLRQRVSWRLRVLFLPCPNGEAVDREFQEGGLCGVGSDASRFIMGGLGFCCGPQAPPIRARWETAVKGPLKFCQTHEDHCEKCPGLIVFSCRWNPIK